MNQGEIFMAGVVVGAGSFMVIRATFWLISVFIWSYKHV